MKEKEVLGITENVLYIVLGGGLQLVHVCVKNVLSCTVKILLSGICCTALFLLKMCLF
jgi:hypothetical protein